jgi:cytochrome c oxidase assembly protein subunit 15
MTGMRRVTKWLAIAAAAVMVLVIIQGSLVTTTGSAEGCGQSWPLCHGKFIPQYTVETAFEYSHRLVTSVAGILIVATAIGALAFWRQRLEVKIYVPMMLFFLVLQAGLGAAAVMWPQSDEVRALHFGISLMALASIVLLAAFINEMHGADRLRDRPIPRAMVLTVWGLAVYTILVVYFGAYVRHTDSSLACTDWPLCNGSVFPGFSGPVGIIFTHRISGLVLILATGLLLYWAARIRTSRPDLMWASLVAIGLVLVQAVSGALVVWTRMDLFARMLHSVLVMLFFSTLAYLCVHVLPRPAAVRSETPVVERTDPRTAPVSPAASPGD